MSSDVAWTVQDAAVYDELRRGTWMTKDTAVGDELHRGTWMTKEAVAGDELQRGVDGGGCGRRRRAPAWGVDDGGRGRRRQALTWRGRWRMWLPATSSSVGHGRLDHRRRRFGARLLISGRYRLIPRKYHILRGKNRMISDRYHLIPHKYHLIHGRIT